MKIVGGECNIFVDLYHRFSEEGHRGLSIRYTGHYQNTRTFSCSFFGDIKYFISRFSIVVYFCLHYNDIFT
jgi:hypothetical protein